jgi:hypothetical protein
LRQNFYCYRIVTQFVIHLVRRTRHDVILPYNRESVGHRGERGEETMKNYVYITVVVDRNEEDDHHQVDK